MQRLQSVVLTARLPGIMMCILDGNNGKINGDSRANNKGYNTG